jgi:hypothetical protein
MISRGYTVAATFLLSVALVMTCSHKGTEPPKNVVDLTAPVIDSVSTNAAAVGQSLIVYGKRFGATQDSTSAVLVGGKPLTILSWCDTLINTSIHDSAETGKLYVRVGNKRSNKLVFTVITTPVIARIDPARGTYGTGVTIFGVCLGEKRGVANVLFGNEEGYVYSRSDTSIYTKYPQGCESDSVRVTIYSLRSNAVPYRVHGITEISPSIVLPGDTTTIHGSGFGAEQGTGFVSLDNINLPVVSWSDDSIEVAITFGAGTGEISVTVESLASNSILCTVHLPAPVIESLSASTARVGQSLSVYGRWFGATQDSASAVLIGGKPLSIASWCDTLINTSIPDSVETGKLYVRVGDKKSNELAFTVIKAPVVTRIDPAKGTYGNGLTIFGRDFGQESDSVRVFFGDLESVVYALSDSSISTAYPYGSLSSTLFVEASSLRSNSLPYAVFGIIGLSSSSADILDTVSILGHGFGDDVSTGKLELGDLEISPLTWTDEVISFILPMNAATGQVTVAIDDIRSNSVQLEVHLPLDLITLLHQTNVVTIKYTGHMMCVSCYSSHFTERDCDTVIGRYTKQAANSLEHPIVWYADSFVVVFDTLIYHGIDYEHRYSEGAAGKVSATGNALLSAQAGFSDWTMDYGDISSHSVSVKGKDLALSALDSSLVRITYQTTDQFGPVSQGRAGEDSYRSDMMPWEAQSSGTYFCTDSLNAIYPREIIVTFEKK